MLKFPLRTLSNYRSLHTPVQVSIGHLQIQLLSTYPVWNESESGLLLQNEVGNSNIFDF